MNTVAQPAPSPTPSSSVSSSVSTSDTPLIQAAALRERLVEGPSSSTTASPLILDASFDLAQPEAGRLAWSQGHVPGARYVHLDQDLSAAKTGRNGRHPLPTRDAFARTAAAWGLAPERDVVVYDRQGGMYAARVWWMLRWLGHTRVQVLDGGWAAWCAAGGAVSTDNELTAQLDAHDPRSVYPLSDEPGMPLWTIDQVHAALGRIVIVDARAPERFRGEVEPLDAVAGHIPGAVNRLFQLNLGGDGCFKPADELRAAFAPLLRAGLPVVHQCGSGVTACHNLLAVVAAGLPVGALYAGSWSEWSSDPARPVARG